jgi:transposase
MNKDGKYIRQQQFPTSEVNLINQVNAVAAERKHLTIEQGTMSFWAAEVLQDFVDELIICDPRHNKLITKAENKNDRTDTLSLCTLLRLGNLKEIWRPKQMGIRRIFFEQVKEYQRITKTLSIHKRQLGDVLRHWGITRKVRKKDYTDPAELLAGVAEPLLREELEEKIRFIRQLAARKRQQKQRFIRTGTRFWEIKEFMKIPGVAEVGAHTFSGYIQTPYRFRRSGQLIKFCKLAVRKFTSDGKPVRSERLSKAGHGCLKALSHVAWKSSQGSDNQVSRYYQACLEKVGDAVHARLSTQRKILTTMWALWKNKQAYDPDKFTYKPNHGDSDR